MTSEVTQAPINMNAIVLQCEAASERDKMWHRRWKALRALNYHNTNFADQDGSWTLADFIAYAGEVCGFKADTDAAVHRLAHRGGEVVAWQGIESAPKDGTPFLAVVAGEEYPVTLRWNAYDAAAQEEIGEVGYFHYADEALAEIDPDALQRFSEGFVWQHLPALGDTP